MRLQRLSLSLFGAVAFASVVLAAATVWLFLTNPVTVATAVNEGDVSPLVRQPRGSAVHRAARFAATTSVTARVLKPDATLAAPDARFRNRDRIHPSRYLNGVLPVL